MSEAKLCGAMLVAAPVSTTMPRASGMREAFCKLSSIAMVFPGALDSECCVKEVRCSQLAAKDSSSKLLKL